MIKIIRILIRVLIIYFVLCFQFLPFIYSSAGTSVFNFLKINPAARTSGMGEVNSVITSQSIQNNPAMIPWLEKKEISYQNLLYLSDFNYNVLTYAGRYNDVSGLGVSLGYLGINNKIVKTVAADNIDGYLEQGTFDFNNTFFNIGYGKKVSSDFSYGTSITVVKENIDNNESIGYMGSFSCSYSQHKRFYESKGLYNKVQKKFYVVNFGVFNIGPQVNGYDLPSGGYLNMGRILNNVFIAGEFISYMDQTSELRTGLEYNIYDILFLRAGYKYPLKDNDLGDLYSSNVSGGIGFRIENFLIDYAWLGYGDLGQTHRLTITAEIGCE